MKAAWQFMILALLGLREHHHLLEVGCGSLRAGRLFIPYLQAGHYCGVDASESAIALGIAKELGSDILEVKQPQFAFNSDFNFDSFGQQFDFILAHGLIIHITDAQVKRLFASAASVLKKNGLFIANYVVGHDRGKSRITYPQTTTRSQRTIRMAAVGAGLKFAPLPVKARHPHGQWFALTQRKSTPKMALNQYWLREPYGK
jgi:cyclopropane fatty-acyl-phospholipid synthase-like methyltransferase